MLSWFASLQDAKRWVCYKAPKSAPQEERVSKGSFWYISCMFSHFHHIQLSETLWTAAYHSMTFPRQEYWSGLPFPSSGDLPGTRIEPPSPSCIAGEFFTAEPPPTCSHFLHVSCIPLFFLSTHPILGLTCNHQILQRGQKQFK